MSFLINRSIKIALARTQPLSPTCSYRQTILLARTFHSNITAKMPDKEDIATAYPVCASFAMLEFEQNSTRSFMRYTLPSVGALEHQEAED